MNIAYFGTPDLSASLLSLILSDKANVTYVVTQPDRPAGKRLELSPSPVKAVAHQNGIEFFDENLSKGTSLSLANKLKERNIDLCILFAYGEIIRTELLKAPKYGFWNIHPSLLPLYRGASPTVYPLLLGEKATGTTLMQMNEKLDEGDIIYQNSFPISDSMLRPDIERETIRSAVEQVTRGIQDINNIHAIKHPQDHTHATYTRKITRSDGFIDLAYLKAAIRGESRDLAPPAIISDYYISNNLSLPRPETSASTVDRMYRALTPWPGIWTEAVIHDQTKRIKINSLHLVDHQIVIDQLQLAGKASVDFQTFERAYNIF